MKWETRRRMKKTATKPLPSTAKQKLHAIQHTKKHLARSARLRAFLQAFFYFFSVFILFASFQTSSKKVIVYAGINREIKWLWKMNELREKHKHTHKISYMNIQTKEKWKAVICSITCFSSFNVPNSKHSVRTHSLAHTFIIFFAFKNIKKW